MGKVVASEMPEHFRTPNIRSARDDRTKVCGHTVDDTGRTQVWRLVALCLGSDKE